MGDERVGVGKGGRVWLGWNGVGDKERERDWKEERKRREGKVLAPPWQA